MLALPALEISGKRARAPLAGQQPRNTTTNRSVRFVAVDLVAQFNRDQCAQVCDALGVAAGKLYLLHRMASSIAASSNFPNIIP